jgi:AcrR family transcriptional regulator
MAKTRKRGRRAQREAPAGRAEQKRRTRLTILEAARARFAGVGYEAATIRDIADAAGVSVGSVHAHFGDKQVLLLACFHAQIDAAVDEALSTLDEQAPLVDQLVHCGRCLYRAYLRHPALSREMVRTTLFPGPDTPDDEQLAHFLTEVARLHRLALERGELERLPRGGALAAQSFFASYIVVLIGGLGDYFGSADQPGAAEIWAKQLRELVELQLRGLGLNDRSNDGDTTCTHHES